MQAFVRRTALTLKPDESVPIVVYFEDGAAIPSEVVRPDLTRLALDPNATTSRPTGKVLKDGWREANRERVVYGEAERRILAALPEHAQRNVLAEFMRYFAAHGVDVAKWPKAAQERKNEIERSWVYIDAVRRAAKTMAGAPLPADPTADMHWPKAI